MSAIWASFSGWTSSVGGGWFLAGDVIATIVVGVGIILEIPEKPNFREIFAVGLVGFGVLAETFFSVALFVSDDTVIKRQNDKIIALEEEIAPRALSKAQYDAFVRAVRGKVPAVTVAWQNSSNDASRFSWQLAMALQTSGASVEACGAGSFGQAGSVVVFPGKLPDDWATEPLVVGLNAVGANPVMVTGPETFARLGNCPKTTTLVFIGERSFPYSAKPYLGP